jgi:hypothetical protein
VCRHTAASLGLEAGLDVKVASDRLGRSTTRIAQDLYTYVRYEVHAAAAAQIVDVLRPASREAGWADRSASRYPGSDGTDPEAHQPRSDRATGLYWNRDPKALAGSCSSSPS